jgi:tRNA pseudouridine55 synthase
LKKKPSEYNGVVVIDKPAGMTSHDVVNRLRRLYQTRRVGHTGTLDPDATGVLVVCLGYATRLAEYLSSSEKAYQTEIQLGIETDTQDASGVTTAICDASHISEAQLREACKQFTGKIEQVPPMVSALHHEGKRLYDLAREGIVVEREAREITISHLELLQFSPQEHPRATLEVVCSTGTYIRTLAADMGASLGVGGIMSRLRRLWVGNQSHAFTLSEAHTLDGLQALAEVGRLGESVLSVASALRGWQLVSLTEEETLRLCQGQSVRFPSFPETERGYSALSGESSLVGVLNPQGEVFALARLSASQLQPVKVLFPCDGRQNEAS